SGEEDTCLKCHGNSADRNQMQLGGYLTASASRDYKNIEVELRKPYNHPVLSTNGVHQQRELIPEELVNARRHAECIDCHEPHQLQKNAPYRGISKRGVGNFSADVTQEYELCYKCHADSANLPADSSNKREEFRRSNPSFHPIEGEGANAYVISLKAPYKARKEQPGDVSIISCSSCHGSDNPASPKGPHGSIYPGLLVDNYEMGSGLRENQRAYALCYRCHERSSILGNESFAYHALHIQGNGTRNFAGTSCFTCHDAHGSRVNQYLIRFDPNVVEPNIRGDLKFKATGVASRHGSCALSCHGVEHAPKSY
ncbi:MAG: cytochrome c3 family protein, partial [Geopsychrobacter sp.]|nr:cytochrome c3 family protein [Geopsychrobacter sp.]